MNRHRVMEAQRIAREQHAMEGRNVGVKSAVSNAARILFPQNHENAVRRQVSNEMRARQGQYISRPTRRTNGSQPTGRERALARADRWAQSQGYYIDAGGPDIVDGL